MINKTKIARYYLARMPKVPTVKCEVFSDEWNDFTSYWFSKIYDYLYNNLGDFIGKLSGKINPLSQDHKDKNINALYKPSTGDIFLRDDAEDNISYLLGNLFHEMVHANLGDLYKGPFFTEGFTDYLCEVMADNDFWGEHRDIMYKGFISSNKIRRENAIKEPTQFNVERWNGQVWARENIGPDIVNAIRKAKLRAELH